MWGVRREEGERLLQPRWGGRAAPVVRFVEGAQPSVAPHREVTDGESGPVHVLQAAAPVVGHLDAEQVLHARVPRGGQRVHIHLAAQQRALELKAHDHVHRCATQPTRARRGSAGQDGSA
jgi:hypothetical protein